MQENQNQDKNSSHVSPLTSDVNEVNLMDYLIVLMRRKRLVLGITLGAAIITAIISLIMPPVYRAETKILPPQTSPSVAMAMLGQAGGGLSELAGGALGIKTPGDLYVALAKSRTVSDSIIDRFNLMKLYDKKYRDDMRKNLTDDILDTKTDKKSGLVTLAVEDKDPKRAADMANAFVEELNKLNKGLAITEAARRRLFFEEQLKTTKADMTKAEDSMKGLMEQTGVMQIDEQARAAIKGIAELRARIASKEVELRVMRTFSTANNPDLQMAETALKGMKAELGKLESKKGGGYDPLMPTGRMPEASLDYMRKLRDLKFNETLFDLLAKQYELAKLDEARDAAVIQVVDEAVPPDKRVKPKRTSMVIIATFLGFFLSVFAVFLIEYKEKVLSVPENKERFKTFMQLLSFKARK